MPKAKNATSLYIASTLARSYKNILKIAKMIKNIPEFIKKRLLFSIPQIVIVPEYKTHVREIKYHVILKS